MHPRWLGYPPGRKDASGCVFRGDIDVTVRRLVKYLSPGKGGEGQWARISGRITGARKRTAMDRKSRAVQLGFGFREEAKKRRKRREQESRPETAAESWFGRDQSC